MQDYNTPQKLTDFVDALRITEIRDRSYIFTFFNGFTGNAYVFRIYKEVFDSMMENRNIIDMIVDVFDPRKQMEELRKETDKMVT
jgi:hypothetical protein